MGQNVTVRAKEFPDLVVDRTHGTLLNTNRKRLLMYKKQRAELIKNKGNAQRIESLEVQLKALQLIVENMSKRPVEYNAK